MFWEMLLFADMWDLNKEGKLFNTSSSAHQQIRTSLNVTEFEMRSRENDILFQEIFGVSTTFCITIQ